MLCLLAATGELLKHNTLQARIVVQAIPRESRTVDIALDDAMDGNRHITLGIKIQVLLNLGCTHVLNDFSANFQVATALRELALNFAFRAAREGKKVELIDLDMVNTYFRLTERGKMVEQKEIRLDSPNFACSGIDSLSLPAEVQSAFVLDWDSVIFDVGGDDVGATALGQLHRQIETAGYEMLYVVNRYRVLSTKPEETLPLLREIETASHLKATAIVNNSNLAVQTDMQTVLNAVPFAKKAAELCHLPLLYSTVPDFAVENTLPEGFKAVKRFVRFVWEDETE